MTTIATPGQRIRFADDRHWWTIQATDQRWIIAVRQADFRPKGVLCYTIVDTASGIRGACNLIGQGWGDGSYSVTECEEMLAALRLGQTPLSERGWTVIKRDERGQPTGWLVEGVTVEISHRNRVPCAAIELEPSP